MATTITYKGDTLASFATGTKILKTSGKFLEDDITVAANSASSAIVVTTEPDGNGGTIEHITAVDISNDTVTAAALLYGYTAHDNTGTAITGSYVAPTLGTKSISANGTYAASSDSLGGYSSVTVNVQPTLQSKTATPTESAQTISADNGYDGLSSVEVGAISSTYVGSGIARRDETNLSASGATVTVPAGYYAEQETKSVTTMTLPTSASSSATSGYTSKATISRSTSDQYINIPPGYNSAGGYYKINAVANGSVTAPSSISGSSATVSTGTNTLTLTKTVSVTPNVTTAGYISSGTAGNSSISLTASVTTKAAATYNVSSSNQTISASQYLTGAQTIRGVTTSGISAANIKAGVTVKVGDSADDDRITAVTGTFTSDANATAADIVSGKSGYVNGSKVDGSLVVQNYYTGTSVPSSGTGSNGDLYFQTTGGQ